MNSWSEVITRDVAIEFALQMHGKVIPLTILTAIASPASHGSSTFTRLVLALITLQWRHSGRYNVSNHQPHDCLLNRLFSRGSKKTSKLRVSGLCAGSSPVTGEFPAQMATNAENVSIWWRRHDRGEMAIRVVCIDFSIAKIVNT